MGVGVAVAEVSGGITNDGGRLVGRASSGLSQQPDEGSVGRRGDETVRRRRTLTTIPLTLPRCHETIMNADGTPMRVPVGSYRRGEVDAACPRRYGRIRRCSRPATHHIARPPGRSNETLLGA
jgi:hypothetical protein